MKKWIIYAGAVALALALGTYFLTAWYVELDEARQLVDRLLPNRFRIDRASPASDPSRSEPARRR